MNVEERLTKLESRHRTWRLLTVLLGVVTVALAANVVWLTGAAGSRELPVMESVRARAFVVVDDHGKMQGKLTTAANGGGMLGLGSIPGREHASALIVGDSDGVGHVWLWRQDGGLGTYITSKGDDGLLNLYGGGVRVWNSNGQTVALLVNSESQECHGGLLAIADADGKYVDGVMATKTKKH